MARREAMTTKNIISGFRCCGLDPLLTATQWLDAYGERHKIKMTSTPLEMLEERVTQAEKAMKSDRWLDALDLAIHRPQIDKYTLPIPSIHKKHRRPPRVNIIGERLGAPKILTLPSRIVKLTQEEKRRKANHEIIVKQKEERRIAKEKRRREEKLKKEEKQKEEARMKSVTLVVVAAGYCKRTPPTMKQIKNYLKGVHAYKETQLKHLNEENIVAEFRKLVRSKKAVVKPEKVSRARKHTMKPKPQLKGKKRKPEFITPKRKRVKEESMT